jgi:hypothetical protein
MIAIDGIVCPTNHPKGKFLGPLVFYDSRVSGGWDK